MIPVGKASSKPIRNSALDFNAANRELKQTCSTRTLLRGWAWWGCSALSPSTSNCPQWGAWNLSCKVALLQQKHTITYHHLPSTNAKRATISPSITLTAKNLLGKLPDPIMKWYIVIRIAGCDQVRVKPYPHSVLRSKHQVNSCTYICKCHYGILC